MPTINQSQRQVITLEAGLTLRVIAAVVSTGIVRRIKTNPGDQNLTGFNSRNIGASDNVAFGPYPTDRSYSIECATGSIDYSVSQEDRQFATQFGNIEPFTGNRTLTEDDNGKVLRCDDASAVVITVPPELPVGFNVCVSQWGAGSVTYTAASGMTSRSSATMVSAQYKLSSLVVMKAGEYVIGGDVS
jgi:hypothetical protein